MFDLIFAVVAAGLNAAGGAPEPNAATRTQATSVVAPQVTSPNVSIGEGSVVIGQGALVNGLPAAPAQPAPIPVQSPEGAFNMSVVPAGLVADPQTPTGKFTTAAEVKPIMQATKGNWVAVREYDGHDLLYVTHIWAWRCGLHAMAISVNGETMQNWPLPECHMKYTTPGAILEEDGTPFLRMRLGSIETIEIQIVYDDLTIEAATFERGNVLIP
jgi:hypothetical protein